MKQMSWKYHLVSGFTDLSYSEGLQTKSVGLKNKGFQWKINFRDLIPPQKPILGGGANLVIFLQVLKQISTFSGDIRAIWANCPKFWFCPFFGVDWQPCSWINLNPNKQGKQIKISDTNISEPDIQSRAGLKIQERIGPTQSFSSTYIMTKFRQSYITPTEIHWVFITEILTFSKNFCSCRCGSSLPGLRKWDLAHSI